MHQLNVSNLENQKDHHESKKKVQMIKIMTNILWTILTYLF